MLHIWLLLCQIEAPWPVNAAKTEGKNNDAKHVKHQAVAPAYQNQGRDPQSEGIYVFVGSSLAVLATGGINECVSVDAPSDLSEHDKAPSEVDGDLDHGRVPTDFPNAQQYDRPQKLQYDDALVNGQPHWQLADAVSCPLVVEKYQQKANVEEKDCGDDGPATYFPALGPSHLLSKDDFEHAIWLVQVPLARLQNRRVMVTHALRNIL